MRSSSDASRRRILYLLTSDISAQFVRGQLAYLVDHGFEVEVGVRRRVPPAEFDDGVVVHDMPFERDPQLAHDMRALWATLHLIHRVRPDIVNASTPKAGLIGMIAAWCCRVPRRVYLVRGLRYETLAPTRRRLFVALERLATACATDVVFNSRSLLRLAEDERSIRRGKGIVLGAGSGNGIDAGRFTDRLARAEARAELGLPPHRPVVGFVGRLTRDKGVVDLVRAWQASVADTTLLLVGDFEDGDPVPAETREQIESSPHIVHIPWVDDAARVYPAMDVLAFPSYREGLPNVPLEAQLCEIPIVAYAATGTVDAVGPTSRLAPVGNWPALGRELRAVLSDPPRDGLQDTRSWVVEQFDQPAVWERFADLYRTRGK